jgi:hypothetical protein
MIQLLQLQPVKRRLPVHHFHRRFHFIRFPAIQDNGSKFSRRSEQAKIASFEAIFYNLFYSKFL